MSRRRVVHRLNVPFYKSNDVSYNEAHVVTIGLVLLHPGNQAFSPLSRRGVKLVLNRYLFLNIFVYSLNKCIIKVIYLLRNYKKEVTFTSRIFLGNWHVRLSSLHNQICRLFIGALDKPGLTHQSRNYQPLCFYYNKLLA